MECRESKSKMRRQSWELVVHIYNPSYWGESYIETALIQQGYIKKCPRQKRVMEWLKWKHACLKSEAEKTKEDKDVMKV
jgi:hypothetical protein